MKNWVIALSTAALYLTASIVTGAWQYTWLIWVIYAAYRLFEGRTARKENGGQ